MKRMTDPTVRPDWRYIQDLRRKAEMYASAMDYDSEFMARCYGHKENRVAPLLRIIRRREMQLRDWREAMAALNPNAKAVLEAYQSTQFPVYYVGDLDIDLQILAGGLTEWNKPIPERFVWVARLKCTHLCYNESYLKMIVEAISRDSEGTDFAFWAISHGRSLRLKNADAARDFFRLPDSEVWMRHGHYWFD